MRSTVQQRSDYTFKANRSLGRHGWLRLTPAYGVKLVEKLLSSSNTEAIILDPFSGTATTGLVAAELGYKAYSFDINPFLIWLGNAKYRNYAEDCLLDIREKAWQALKEYKSQLEQDNWIPQIFNIERWWSGYTLNVLAALRTALVEQFGEPEENDEYSVVYIVGNSTFFGNMVDTAALFSDSMRILGYSKIHSEIVRKRNCNKALYEYCVSAIWSAG